ncbi:MAG TPA: LLM class flavin-dependent oxidoreductase [Gemmatimonadaceae bacterium]|jgi:probable LLM family oxidoreductase|nr:LLM class flavin-dependent oxidoreductase [Gemmatimonadaceae bacterium]
MQLGLYTFADVARESRLREVVEEAELAEQVGLEVFGVGEHHRPDFVASAPAVVLAAIAARTSRLRLTSAVTVLSSDDPVRVFQEFATLDLLSGGRAEIMAGRGSFIESFPLFGYDLDDYDALFAEKLDLLLALRASERITWSGTYRAPISNLGVYPRPIQNPLPVWIAVGGTPQSVVRAGSLRLPMALAIIGGPWERFVPLAAYYRRAGGTTLGLNSHGHIAETMQRAMDEYYPTYAAMMTRIGRERGWPPMTRQQYEAMCGPDGALFVGDPETVAEKIIRQHEAFGHQRFLLSLAFGSMPREQALRSIELFGTQVAPMVHKEVAMTPVGIAGDIVGHE